MIVFVPVKAAVTNKFIAVLLNIYCITGGILSPNRNVCALLFYSDPVLQNVSEKRKYIIPFHQIEYID